VAALAGERHSVSFDDLVRLDFYLENWSIWLDISILDEDGAHDSHRRGGFGSPRSAR
jgi:hypothetical protein